MKHIMVTTKQAMEVSTMAENEKQILRNMEAAIAALPEEKKQFFLGYAEGVAAMADQIKDKKLA